jgi:uncharacterized protein
MAQRRTVDSPLHHGRAPRWLFERMDALAGEIVRLMVLDAGPAEVLRHLADPWWFQAFGCVLGFDWHASGLTTVTCGALKAAATRLGADFGLVVAGGKGKTSRKTPDEITEACMQSGLDATPLVRTSRLVAKVDSAAVQDGFELYHHSFFFDRAGNWCVVQQGMNDATSRARRYHWLSETVADYTCEPHAGIVQESPPPPGAAVPILNLVASECADNRTCQAELSRLPPAELAKLFRPELVLPAHHGLDVSPFRDAHLKKLVASLSARQAPDFTALLEIQGVGPKAVRSLALIAEVIYGKAPSFRDPARFSFAHGGKDGIPFPVRTDEYDRNIALLRETVNSAKLGYYEKTRALERLGRAAARAHAASDSSAAAP